MKNIDLFNGKNWTKVGNKLYASAGQILVGKREGTLNAYGGDCRVIVIYDDSLKMGALIHIDASDIYNDSFKSLIDSLLDKFKFSQASLSVLCGDLRTGYFGD